MMFLKSVTEIYIAYILVYLFLLFYGRSFLKFYLYTVNRNFDIPRLIFSTNVVIFYPIFGYFFLGNTLVLVNFAFPLASNFTIITIFLIALFGLNFKKTSINLSSFFNKDIFVMYFLIPFILIFSTYDINYHYDAGFYHLNHQNWLRNSNIVFGMVNIFWPFGIGSLSEYVSAFFWKKNTLINLHYISIVFIHCFFQFLYFHVFKKENSKFKFMSIMILIFSILDNFGFGGGRNGFIYIQEIGKQDTLVSILIILVGMVIAIDLQENKYSLSEKGLIISLVILSFQLKIGSIYLIILLFYYFINLLINKQIYLKSFVYINFTSILFSSIWFLKNLIISGCFIFPVSFTCINNFNWYRIESTKIIEAYTSRTSFGLKEYVNIQNFDFNLWFKEFFINNPPYSIFYKNYYLNFVISFVLILLFKTLFTETSKVFRKTYFIIVVYLFISIIFLMLYGPIPRYTSGILTFAVSIIGLNIVNFRYRLPKTLYLLVFIISLSSLPRLNSYLNGFQNSNISLADPRFELNDYSLKLNGNWVSPASTDQCWININCTSEVGGKIIITEKFFKSVNRVLD